MKHVLSIAILLLCAFSVGAQEKPRSQVPTQVSAQLDKLHDDYVKATKDYKASLEKLLPLYERGHATAEQRFAQSKELFKQNLISPRELDDSGRAAAEAKAKVDEVHEQMTGADTQAAQALAEIDKPETKAQLAREYKRA